MPRNTTVGLIFLIVIVGLQIFLSKKQNKWYGLVLPIISLMFSFIGLASYAFFDQNISQIIIELIAIFIMANIPTVILLVIYFACRESIKKDKEIDKMKIEDL